MKYIIQNIKKSLLFLFGIVLIIWGYKVNASNSEEKTQNEKDKAVQETEKQPDIISVQDSVKQDETPKTKVESAVVDTEKKKQTEKKAKEEPVKKVEETKETVIETATPEEASGTE